MAAKLAIGLSLTLLALGVRAGPSLGTPGSVRGRALQDIVGCDFTSEDSGVITSAWVESKGWVLATPKAALECINQISVDYDFAYDSVTNLGKIFNQSYAFVALAANPTYGVPFSALVHNYSVDVPGELQDLADSFDKKAGYVGLGDLQFAVTHIFNRLFDAHVTPAGAGGGRSGTYLGNALRSVTQLSDNVTRSGDGRAYLVDTSDSSLLASIEVAKGTDGKIAVRGLFLQPSKAAKYKTFATINGGSAFDWFVKLSSNPALSLPFKPPGTRVNQMLKQFEFLFVNNLGDILSLPNANITYTDGSKGSLVWGVTFAPIVSAARLTQLQDAANTPGVPYRALLKAATYYLYGNTTVAPAEAPEEPSPSISETAVFKEARRRLQAGASLPSNLNYLGPSDQPYGFWYVNKTAAVLKLTTFAIEADDVSKWWPQLVAASKKAGATNLIIDLVGNGGGSVLAGVNLALALFPEATYGDFGLRYDRIIGDDAVFAYANGLTISNLNASLYALAANSSYVSARVSQIAGNATEFKRLTAFTRTIVDTLTVLFSNVQQDQFQICNIPGGGRTKCVALWEQLAPQTIDFISGVAGSKLTAKNFISLLTNYLAPLLDVFFPYTGAPGDDKSDPYASPQLAMRGGKPRYYTAKFDLMGLPKAYSARDAFDLPDYKPPFTKILALSDGQCGSTCDTFSRSSWFFSKTHPEAPVFRYLTYGGTGKAVDAGATAFPGGNVNGADLLTSTWAYYVIGSLTSDWIGSPELAATFDAFSERVPIFPAFLDQFTPTYTQSEVYQAGALGNDSLPTEYIKIPTDYYTPVWYTATGLPEPESPSDLPALYATAAATLAQLPSPKAQG